MTEVQITVTLVGLVAILIGLRAYRRRAKTIEEMEDDLPAPKKSVSYATGRDESQWRRAYSRG